MSFWYIIDSRIPDRVCWTNRWICRTAYAGFIITITIIFVVVVIIIVIVVI
jgi:hypothetical protein